MRWLKDVLGLRFTFDDRDRVILIIPVGDGDCGVRTRDACQDTDEKPTYRTQRSCTAQGSHRSDRYFFFFAGFFFAGAFLAGFFAVFFAFIASSSSLSLESAFERCQCENFLLRSQMDFSADRYRRFR
ncbi:MAG: hypothetical protein NW223_00410 [Hyphomicrobiaceae bacterium]|nr:hypothetical protein [Hyphomicrobiaceae bacterium]